MNQLFREAVPNPDSVIRAPSAPLLDLIHLRVAQTLNPQAPHVCGAFRCMVTRSFHKAQIEITEHIMNCMLFVRPCQTSREKMIAKLEKLVWTIPGRTRYEGVSIAAVRRFSQHVGQIGTS